eukprot:TRINITY_DN6902_c0_g1_i4.p1 TRINITY_DN6902_c0_g1~~TRINITY_DN6902_c0_g1_i4.p1  ORF type:complete len:566 (-),score=140.46 TRINITY_DN6902_c0_g1_i4:109-1806(-)
MRRGGILLLLVLFFTDFGTATKDSDKGFKQLAFRQKILSTQQARGAIDAIVVLDESNSISDVDFDVARVACQQIVEQYSGLNVHFGIILFSNDPRTISPLSPDRASVLQALHDVSRLPGSTDTRAALAAAKRMFQDHGRRDAQRVVFLITDGRPNSSPVAKGVILQSTTIPRAFLLELLICLPHPFPGLPETPSKVFTLWMFLRLYILWKVLRDRSLIFRKRKIIEHIPGYSPHAHPNFNALLSMKFIFYQRPILLITTALLSTSFVFAYAIFIFERGSKFDHVTGEPIFTFWICYYISIQTLLTGWPTDIWSVYMHGTWVGKFISIGSSVFGLFMFALLIDYVHTKMQPTSFERSALEWVIRRKWEQKERLDAARLIQIFWRHYRYKAMRKHLNAFDEQEDRKRRYLFTLEWLKQVETTRVHRGKKLRDLGMRGFIDTRQQLKAKVTTSPSVDAPTPVPAGGPGGLGSSSVSMLFEQIDVQSVIRDQVQQTVADAMAEHRQEMKRTLDELHRVSGLLAALSAGVTIGNPAVFGSGFLFFFLAVFFFLFFFSFFFLFFRLGGSSF